MKESALRELIAILIEEAAVTSPAGDELLTEPDGSVGPDDGPDEASGTSATGGGPAMPLGAGPSYPGPESRTQKSARREITRVTGASFGGALPVKKNSRP